MVDDHVKKVSTDLNVCQCNTLICVEKGKGKCSVQNESISPLYRSLLSKTSIVLSLALLACQKLMFHPEENDLQGQFQSYSGSGNNTFISLKLLI